MTLTEDDFVGESVYNDLLAPGRRRAGRGSACCARATARSCVFPAGLHRPRRRAAAAHRAQAATAATATPPPTWPRSATASQELGATRLLYVVGAPQHQHLEMVFAGRPGGRLAGARRRGPSTSASARSSAPDGKMLRSPGRRVGQAGRPARRGGRPGRGDRRGEEPGRSTPDQQAAVARAVGIGAIKYADLSSDRIKDYVFDWDRMLAFDGNTAPYLQYAHARIRSIFRRGGDRRSASAAVHRIAEPAERALALELLGFAGGGRRGRRDPAVPPAHRLPARARRARSPRSTSSCPVLQGRRRHVRASRLALCDLTARVSTQGLDLLGIAAPEPM